MPLAGQMQNPLSFGAALSKYLQPLHLTTTTASTVGALSTSTQAHSSRSALSYHARSQNLLYSASASINRIAVTSVHLGPAILAVFFGRLVPTSLGGNDKAAHRAAPLIPAKMLPPPMHHRRNVSGGNAVKVLRQIVIGICVDSAFSAKLFKRFLTFFRLLTDISDCRLAAYLFIHCQPSST